VLAPPDNVKVVSICVRHEHGALLALPWLLTFKDKGNRPHEPSLPVDALKEAGNRIRDELTDRAAFTESTEHERRAVTRLYQLLNERLDQGSPHLGVERTELDRSVVDLGWGVYAENNEPLDISALVETEAVHLERNHVNVLPNRTMR